MTGANNEVTVDTPGSGPSNELTFSPSGWNRRQSVRVTAADDAGNTECHTVVTTATGGDYNESVTRRTGTEVTVRGHWHSAGVVVNPTVLTVEEGRSTSYRVVLTS